MIWLVSVLLVVSIYVNINLFRKNEKLEDANEETFDWIVSYYNSLSLILSNIRELDNKDMFEKDDEVGSIYQQISSEIKKLEDLIGK
tara:strand:- start:2207 stop:2467 length:261 start_codon:yes stop_codon:yes gene_type:complete